MNDAAAREGWPERIVRLVGSKSTLIYQPLPVDDPKQRRPNISLAKSQLGWEPKVKLEDGLRLTYEYFRQRVAHAGHPAT